MRKYFVFPDQNLLEEVFDLFLVSKHSLENIIISGDNFTIEASSKDSIAATRTRRSCVGWVVPQNAAPQICTLTSCGLLRYWHGNQYFYSFICWDKTQHICDCSSKNAYCDGFGDHMFEIAAGPRCA